MRQMTTGGVDDFLFLMRPRGPILTAEPRGIRRMSVKSYQINSTRVPVTKFHPFTILNWDAL
jgi:hypothetical protein